MNNASIQDFVFKELFGGVFVSEVKDRKSV